MALNEVIYLPNPEAAQSKTVGIELTAAGAGATTLATITAATYVRVRNFTVCITAIGDGTAEYISGILKIGTGKYTFTVLIPSTATAYHEIFASDGVGFDGAWLQPADTITFQCVVDGGTPTGIRASVSVALEEFTA